MKSSEKIALVLRRKGSYEILLYLQQPKRWQDIKNNFKIRAGNLFHILRPLLKAGLICKRQDFMERTLYVVTDLGKNVINSVNSSFKTFEYFGK